MRFGVAMILVGLLTAGCMDRPAAREQDHPTPFHPVPVTGSLRILVVDEEYAPIQGARVDLPDAALTAETRVDGIAAFRALPPGNYSIAIQHAAYRPNETTAAVLPNETIDVRATLDLIPTAFWTTDLIELSGTCNLAVRASPATEGTCDDGPPPAFPRTSTVSVLLPQNSTNLTLKMAWNMMALQAPLRFELGFGPDIPLRDGRSIVEGEGGSEVTLSLGPELLPAAINDGPLTLYVTPFPGRSGPVQVTGLQPFSILGYVLYLHPPIE